MFNKNLKNVLLVIFATLILSACSTAKKSGNIDGDVYTGKETVKYLASGVPDRIFFATNKSTLTTAYRDTLTPNAADVAEVVSRWKEILNIALNVLAPGKRAFRGAAKNLIYNRNYYKEEITTLVTQQFGGGSWLYNDWIDQVITNLSHDLITTDESKTTTQNTNTNNGKV